MRTVLALLLTTTLAMGLKAQQEVSEVDLNYLEDQFYVGITYNFILNKPEPITQRNLSYGLGIGFIKDIPLNRNRNVAFGVGLGYAVNSYYTNLLVEEVDSGFQYSTLSGETDTKRNKVETHLLEFPLEFRWRTSTPEDYKFWRIYTGLKFSYLLGGRSKRVGDSEKQSFYNTDLRNLQYGLTLNFGYNTFNVHVYYALNNLFEDNLTLTTGEELNFTPLRIGLIFFIL
ncbi:MAG: PorT family protein [Eudoraea sp.]|nr:PorT family protein [Eudoraea sp.]